MSQLEDYIYGNQFIIITGGLKAYVILGKLKENINIVLREQLLLEELYQKLKYKDLVVQTLITLVMVKFNFLI